MELSEKLRDNFDEMVVYKDLKKTNFFSTLSLPAFMRDWLLKNLKTMRANSIKMILQDLSINLFREKAIGMR